MRTPKVEPEAPEARATQPGFESMRVPRLTSAEFSDISCFAKQHFGLDLKNGKEDLVSARLSKRMRQGQYSSFGEYFSAALSDRTGRALTDLIDALTTNHTSFYREPAHFDLLRKLVETEFARVPVLRLWSAACSTGEEPYTIAGCLTAAARREPRTWEMRATDISTRVLEVARRGVYPANAVNALPAEWQRAVFQRGQGRSDGWFRVRGELGSRIQFERINLLEPAPAEGKYHFVFCRNVMIYFDKPTQQRVVERLAGSLESGGYLLVGHSESLAGIDHGLHYVQPATYRKGPNQTSERRNGC